MSGYALTEITNKQLDNTYIKTSNQKIKETKNFVDLVIKLKKAGIPTSTIGDPTILVAMDQSIKGTVTKKTLFNVEGGASVGTNVTVVDFNLGVSAKYGTDMYEGVEVGLNLSYKSQQAPDPKTIEGMSIEKLEALSSILEGEIKPVPTKDTPVVISE